MRQQRPLSLRPTARTTTLAALAAAAALVFASIPASAAFAGPAGSISELQTQLNAGGTVQLTADISAPTTQISMPTTATLDLNGFDLDTSTATIGAGATFTVVDTAGAGSWDAVATTTPNPGIGTLGATLVVDGATIRAAGAADAAGIGGVGSGTVAQRAGGTVTVESGTVTGTGGSRASGIGGAYGGPGGLLTVNGGTVSASGGHQASGIGGGSSAVGGTTIITGGMVTATGNVAAGAGIGSGGGGSIDVAVGPVTTISGGTVIAQGGSSGAGIGGGSDRVGGTTTISGGTVTASGGSFAAGIGGGSRASGGTTEISGGIVAATGGDNAAGIGSGASTVLNGLNGGTSSFTGGVVTVTGGYQAAAIGGGTSATGGAVTIGAGGDVTATGGVPMSAIGGGLHATVFGSLEVAGRLTIPSAAKLAIPTGATATVTATGTITGEGAVNGAGSIVNDGIITNTAVTNLADTAGGLTITVNDYRVSFDGNHEGAAAIDPVRVYATTFDDGERSIPTPTRSGYVIAEWNTAADGSGTALTGSTTLTADMTVYAQWALAGYTVAPASATVTAGDDQQFTVTRAIDFGTEDATDEFTFTSTVASDVIGASGLVGFTAAGDRTITATLTADSSVTVDALVTVNADAANPVVTLTAPTSTAEAGDTIAFGVTVTDPYGNPLAGAADDVVLTSDTVTDIVTGHSVTFLSERTRVITASYGDSTATVTITAPAAIGGGATGGARDGVLAATGAPSSAPIMGIALLELLAGTTLLVARRFRSRARSTR